MRISCIISRIVCLFLGSQIQDPRGPTKVSCSYRASLLFDYTSESALFDRISIHSSAACSQRGACRGHRLSPRGLLGVSKHFVVVMLEIDFKTHHYRPDSRWWIPGQACRPAPRVLFGTSPNRLSQCLSAASTYAEDAFILSNESLCTAMISRGSLACYIDTHRMLSQNHNHNHNVNHNHHNHHNHNHNHNLNHNINSIKLIRLSSMRHSLVARMRICGLSNRHFRPASIRPLACPSTQRQSNHTPLILINLSSHHLVSTLALHFLVSQSAHGLYWSCGSNRILVLIVLCSDDRPPSGRQANIWSRTD